jgi:glycosyltransferase involved in cell wall biosynthesis
MDKTLYLFTSSFPYGNTSEVPFLTNELIYLSREFENIVLVPQHKNSDCILISDKYTVDLGLVEVLSKRNWRALFLLINKDVLLEIILLISRGKIARLRKLWWSLNTISTVIEWVKPKVKKDKSIIFYTYWFTAITIGLALAKNIKQNISLISRAHRGDLYEGRTYLKYFPLRSFALSSLDRLFLISQNGLDYMGAKYPKHKEKFEVAKLGVKVQDSCTSSSENSQSVNIVSCAYIRPVKRIDLLCAAIGKFCFEHKEWSIHWDHFGGGDPQVVRKIELIISQYPSNANCKLWGDVPNSTILEHYKSNVVDFFISVSESEGIPVSIMEAMSFGIPVIATTVNGIPEIVTEENGYLLPANPSVDEISDIIWCALTDSDQRFIKRRNALMQI